MSAVAFKEKKVQILKGRLHHAKDVDPALLEAKGSCSLHNAAWPQLTLDSPVVGKIKNGRQQVDRCLTPVKKEALY